MTYPFERPEIVAYSQLLAESYESLTKKKLIESSNISYDLYYAPFVLVSHGTEPDPIFRYANLKAQELWGLDWDNFLQMPSRLTVKPDEAAKRQQLLDEAASKGYVDNYSGIRITKEGRRFIIENVTLWNVIDSNNIKHGQAAVIYNWK